MKNINKLDNYSLVKKILSNIPSGLDSNLKIINQQALPFVSELSNRLELDSTETVIFSCIIHSQMTQNKCETSRISEISGFTITTSSALNFRAISSGYSPKADGKTSNPNRKRSPRNEP